MISAKKLIRSKIARLQIALSACLLGTLIPATAGAASLADHVFELPSWVEIIRVLTLQDYNTRVVIVGTTLLGLAAGLVGTFLLLRKRALLSDTLSHATLPGIALTFILITHFGGEGKNLVALIFGAAVFSVLGTVSVILIQKYSRLKDDAALGIVLSVYFGLGIALLGIASRMETGTAAGLSSFIYGKTASMLFFDAVLIGATALGSAIVCILMFKEFTLICFDYHYAATQGWPVIRLDFLMMTLVVIVTVIGLQAVGLILVVALLIIPPSAARFWTLRLRNMLILSGLFGGLSGLLGSAFSALMANLPAASAHLLTDRLPVMLVLSLMLAMVSAVLGHVFAITIPTWFGFRDTSTAGMMGVAAGAVFLIVFLFAPRHGLISRTLSQALLALKIARDDILGFLYRFKELAVSDSARLSTDDLRKGLKLGFIANLALWDLKRKGRLIFEGQGLRLTFVGEQEGRGLIRSHRLWEAYLCNQLGACATDVHLPAHKLEHFTDASMQSQLDQKTGHAGVDPHQRKIPDPTEY